MRAFGQKEVVTEMGKRIQVLMVASTDRGGQWTQARKTAESLKKLGIEVDLRICDGNIPTQVDLVHAFSGECLPTVLAAKQAKLPVAVSPIFWPRVEYFRSLEYRDFLSPMEYWLIRLRHSTVGKFLLDGKVERNPFLIYRYRGLEGNAHENMDQERKCFMLADLLLPNAEGEMSAIANFLDLSKTYTVIPNAIDPIVFSAPCNSQIHPELPQKYVLSVSVISPRKNTLKLVRACSALGVPLVLIGPAELSSYLSRAYYRQCRKESSSQIMFLGPITHELLPLFYSRAHIHALVSWYETPGLASLEAAAIGCGIVSTSVGTAREYFGEDAEYCDPADQKSIERAIIRAWDKRPSENLKERVLSEFTWDRAARLTLHAYLKVLKEKTMSNHV